MGSGWNLLLVPAVLAGSFALTFILVRGLIGGLWRTLSSRFPARPIRPGAVTRRGQSIALFGWAGFNGCINISVDEDHLHLVPWSIVRFLGAPPVSIPWGVITDVRPSWPKSYAKARVGGTGLQAPAWCLELAGSPGPDGAEPDAQARVLRDSQS